MRGSSLVVGGLLASALVSCGGGGAGDDGAARTSSDAVEASPELAPQLAQLRRLVAPFHNIQKALDAGWNVQITDCLENPPLGGMGFHYGNPALIDATVDLLHPELLLYEPQRGGHLRFVGVEYIVPYTFAPRDGPAPVLLGQTFHQNDTFQLWGLHIWIGRHNRSGLFADWNPDVSCAFAQ